MCDSSTPFVSQQLDTSEEMWILNGTNEVLIGVTE
jgi:hypothetical protein